MDRSSCPHRHLSHLTGSQSQSYTLRRPQSPDGWSLRGIETLQQQTTSATPAGRRPSPTRLEGPSAAVFRGRRRSIHAEYSRGLPAAPWSDDPGAFHAALAALGGSFDRRAVVVPVERFTVPAPLPPSDRMPELGGLGVCALVIMPPPGIFSRGLPMWPRPWPARHSPRRLAGARPLTCPS